MSDASPSHDEQEPNHEGPIRTPKQLIIAVVASFLIPIFTILMLASYVADGDRHAAGSDGLSPQATNERIAPVTTVAVKDPTDVAAMKSGEEVFKAQCSACHAAGLAGAPKFGDAAAWGPRIKSGYEALLTSALKGKGAMGPQGGGDFSDLEVGRAVVYMANAGGAKFEEPAVPATTASAASGAGDAASAPEPAVATPAAPTASMATAAPPQASAPAAPQPVAVADAGGAAPALYTQICQTCHAAGLIGAPKFGDKAAWAPRLAQGIDTLTQHAIAGKGAMPPKGGAATASDADVKAAVTYMANAAK